MQVITIRCPVCKAELSAPTSTESLPSVVNVQGQEGTTAIVSRFECGCGHAFPTIEYELSAAPRLSEIWTFPQVAAMREAAKK